MKMNQMIFAVAAGLALSAATAAYAEHKYPEDSGSNWPVKSAKTRAQVIEELKEARARGEVRIGEDSQYPEYLLQQPKSPLTRAEVRAEAENAARIGNTGVNSSHIVGG